MSQVLILYSLLSKGFLDPEKKLFSHRILSRDECIDPFSKTGNLRYVCDVCESYALNKTGQIDSTVSSLKFTFSVVNVFLILPYLLLKRQHCLSKTEMLYIAAFHLFVFCGDGKARM